MNKVYLLLRNNKETGPYSLEELVQLGLKPADLIWVEGKSFAWATPVEMGILQPSTVESSDTGAKNGKETLTAFKQMPNLPGNISGRESAKINKDPGPKYIYVSLPYLGDEQSSGLDESSPAKRLEEKADELRRKALAYSPGNKGAEPVNIKRSNAARTVDELQEEYALRVDNQKVPKKSSLLTKVVGTCVAIVLFFAGGYLIAKYTAPSKKIETRDLTVKRNLNRPVVQPVKVVAGASTEVISEEAPQPVSEIISQAESAPLIEITSNITPAPVKKKNLQTGSKKTKVKVAPPEKKELIVEMEKFEPQVADNKVVMSVIKEEGGAVIVQQEKKKTFGQKLGSFFKKSKRKKAEEKLLEEPEKISNHP